MDLFREKHTPQIQCEPFQRARVAPGYRVVSSYVLSCFSCVWLFVTLWTEAARLLLLEVFISSVQFSRSVLSDSLWPHGLQHARPSCLSPTPGVYSNSCALSQWCHPTISSFVIPFSSHPQSFPASGSFQMSQFFASGGQVFLGMVNFIG